jgi:beta-galactosidase
MLSKIDSGALPTDPAQLNALLSSGVDTGTKNGDWSETYICNLFDWHLKEQEAMPWLTGAVKKRNSQDFPAAGLRWHVKLKPGKNHLRVVAHKGAATVSDEINLEYQVEKWEPPAQLELKEIARPGDTVTIQAIVRDAKGVACLDSRSLVRFALDGDGTLLDNLGTSKGSRVLELYNGRAVISLMRNGGKSVVSVSSKGLPTAFLTIE